MKKYKNILIFLLLFIFNFLLTYFSVVNNDLIWNYGFSYNFANGLKMYTDYNMVITPLFPTIFGLIMKLLGKNIIVFYLSFALVPTTIYYLIYKYYKKCLIEVILIASFIISPNYNILCLLFLFILFVLEDKKYNDYIIGIVLGLVFLTKSPTGLLTLASLYYYKDIKKIIKRFIGFLIPNIIYIIYFIINGSLFDYINYAFGSLFDFATKNVRSTFGIIIFIISIILLLVLFKKHKDIKILYILFFQIMSYPIFNMLHILLSLTPVVFYLVYKIKNPFILKYKKILITFIVCPIVATVLTVTNRNLVPGINLLKGKLIEEKYLIDAKRLYEELDGYDDTYFVIYEAYYNKFLYNYPINKYDLLLNGNMGYNGSKNVIKYFKTLKKGTKFVLYADHEGGQVPNDIYDFIEKNYNLTKVFDKYAIYEK